MFRLYTILILFLSFNVLLSQSKDDTKDSIINNYKNSNAVFTGVITNIYEFNGNNKKEPEVVIEFKLTEIYKGKRRENMLTLNSKDISKNLKVNDEYLVYIQKNKVIDKFYITRISNVKEKSINDEINMLYGYLDRKLFRNVKSPVREKPLGCGCY